MTSGPDEPLDPNQQPDSGQAGGQSVPPPYGAPTPPPPADPTLPPPYQQQPPPGVGYGMPYGASPAAPYGVHPVTGVPYSDKSKLVAGLLQIFLGGFGVGRFYIGDTKIGVWQIVVSVLTCFTIGPIWGLIDGIIILATDNVNDAQGRPLRSN